MNNIRLKARLYRICALILGIGLCSAAVIYVAADEAPQGALNYVMVDGTAYPVAPQYSKRYRRDLEQFGGKASVLFDEFNRWFEALWQGKTLGLTLGWISVVVSFAIFLFARWLPTDRKSIDG
jgi:hypothetical protein